MNFRNFYLSVCLILLTTAIQANEEHTAEKPSEQAQQLENTSSASFGQEPVFLIGVNLGYDFVVAGYQLDYAKAGFATDDVLMSSLSGGIAAEFRPWQRLGLQAGYTFGSTSATATSGAVTTNISMYSWQDVQLGAIIPIYRTSVGSENQNTFEIYAGGGVVFTSLDFTSDFKDLLSRSATSQGILLIFRNESATGTGFYFKTGANVFIHEFLYLQADIELKFQKAIFPGATQDLNGTHLGWRLGAGFYF
ncbi:MAG: hypothetical protein KDK41_01335 [Leptospiraceae bacterium]|nr:hypothetical protein [Leptospiraceae bacterium]